MSNNDSDSNGVIYLLAGIGLGALIGAAAGVLLAPKAGSDTREDLAEKFKELKDKTEGWIQEQKAKKAAPAADEIGV
jgi:gas vesicle protein